MENPKVKVSVFEDNNDLRESLSILIRGTEGFELCGAYPDCNKVVENLSESTPDVVLMDIDMPGMSGVEGLKLIRQHFPSVDVLMLTVFEDNEHLFESIQNGANGYLLKKTSPAKIMEALLEVSNGGAPMTSGIARQALELFRHTPRRTEYKLTDRETGILRLLSKGHSYKMIGYELEISIDTVRSHIRKVYEKLQVHSVNAAVAKAINERLV